MKRLLRLPLFLALVALFSAPANAAEIGRHGLQGKQNLYQQMQALLLAEMRRLDDPWRLWNQPEDGPAPPPEGEPSRKGKAAKILNQ